MVNSCSRTFFSKLNLLIVLVYVSTTLASPVDVKRDELEMKSQKFFQTSKEENSDKMLRKREEEIQNLATSVLDTRSDQFTIDNKNT
jgi:hypothetical protein